MMIRFAAAGLIGAALVTPLAAQSGTQAPAKGILHEITVVADEIYTGTMILDVASGKVSGTLKIAAPTPIPAKRLRPKTVHKCQRTGA